jgi:hypothetical protein
MFDLSVALKDKSKPKLEALENKFGKTDFRTQLIGMPLNAILVQILTFKSNQVTFYHHDWWDSLNVPTEGRKGLCEKHDTFVKYMSFIQFFSYVESQLRVLIRKFKPGTCNDGKAAYESIYKKILTDLGLTSYLETFDFSSCIRNALHNSGLYLPTANTNDRTFNFRGHAYKMTYNQMIDFLYPEMVVEIQDETLDCLFKVTEHADIISIS